MGHKTLIEVDLVGIRCYACGVPFWIDKELQKTFLQKREKATFYCPNGHSQCYVGMSKEDKLRKQLEEERSRTDEERNRADRLEADLLAQAKETRRLKRRVSKGVCPCCHRSFTNVQRHMKTQHPEYPERR